MRGCVKLMPPLQARQRLRPTVQPQKSLHKHNTSVDDKLFLWNVVMALINTAWELPRLAGGVATAPWRRRRRPRLGRWRCLHKNLEALLGTQNAVVDLFTKSSHNVWENQVPVRSHDDTSPNSELGGVCRASRTNSRTG